MLDLNQIPALFPRTDLHVALAVEADEFLRNLRAEVLPAEDAEGKGDRLAGTVAADAIRIVRVRSWVFKNVVRWFIRNEFAPQFTGHLTADGRYVHGRFHTAPWVRRFLTVWLVAAAAFVILALVPAVEFEGPVLIPVLMFAAGAVLPQLGWWMGRGDRDRIEAALVRAAGHGDG